MIFWILFVWLPAILYVMLFWRHSINGLYVSFNIKEELIVLSILFLMPPSAVISFCSMLDALIEEYIWR